MKGATRRGRAACWTRLVAGAIVLASLSTLSCAQARPDAQVDLTAEERAWLDAHRDSIRLGSDSQFAPIEFFAANGDHAGIAADYVGIVESRLGIRFQIARYATFGQLLEDARTRKVDVVASMEANEERRKFLSFTEAFSRVPVVFVTREDGSSGTSDLASCAHCKVGVVNGYAVERQIEAQHRSFSLVPVANEVDGLRAVSFGRLDAMAINLATASYHISNEGIGNLRVAGDVGPVNEVGFGVRTDWPLLQSALSKALASIPPAEREQIQSRWIHITPPWWKQRTFWYTLGLLVGIGLAGVGLVVLWNRALRRTVVQRTAQLEAAAEERRKLEAQLAQSQKMEALGRLAGGVAHDFNNLLTVILGNLEFVMLDLPQGSPILRDLDEIKQAASRASDLTRQLLAFGRKEAKSQPAPLDLSAAVAHTQRLIERVIGEDIHLAFSVSSEPLWIAGDATQIDQVVLNLAVNARDAMKGGGTLRIATSAVAIPPGSGDGTSAPPPGSYAELLISDTGVGMSDDVQQRLFEPFFTTKPRGEGTGLGLSIVFGIVRQHAGHIRVTSAPGEGTTFRVSFPRLRDGVPVGESSVPELRPARSAGATTVLLVEDEDGLRNLAARMLESAGYRVISAPDAEQALSLFRASSECISLLITDVVMPGMNGRQLCETVRGDCPTLKVLYISGYTADIIHLDEVTRQGDSLLAKPFTQESFLTHVRRALASHPTGEPHASDEAGTVSATA